MWQNARITHSSRLFSSKINRPTKNIRAHRSKFSQRQRARNLCLMCSRIILFTVAIGRKKNTITHHTWNIADHLSPDKNKVTNDVFCTWWVTHLLVCWRKSVIFPYGPGLYVCFYCWIEVRGDIFIGPIKHRRGDVLPRLMDVMYSQTVPSVCVCVANASTGNCFIRRNAVCK